MSIVYSLYTVLNRTGPYWIYVKAKDYRIGIFIP